MSSVSLSCTQNVERQDRVFLTWLPVGGWGKETDDILDYTPVRLSEFLIYDGSLFRSLLAINEKQLCIHLVLK